MQSHHSDKKKILFSFTMAVFVWQFQRDDGGYSPCLPQTNVVIETAYGSGRNRFAVGKHTIDLQRLTKTSTGSGKVRAIRRIPCTPPPATIMAYWEWDQGGQRFVPYETQASVDIETAYSNGQRSIDLSTAPSRIPYTINMRSQYQTRHRYNTRRQIRRVSLQQPLVTYLQPQPPSQPSPLPSSSSSSSSSSPAATAMAANPQFFSPASAILSGTAAASLAGTGKPSPKKRSKSASSKKTKSSSAATSSSAASTISAATSSSAASSSSTATSSTASSSSVSTSRAATSSRRRAKPAASAPSVADPPLGPLAQFVKRVTVLNFGEDGPCPICMNQLSETSGFEEDVGLPVCTPSSTSSSSSSPSLTSPPLPSLCRLRKCKHILHQACLIMYAKNSPNAKNGLCCPTCKKIHGVRQGDMPKGTMSVSRHNHYSLPGHEGSGVIEITYDFRSGVHNGVRYGTNGFPRICYLPDSERGRKVLRLLKVAWERKLTFTIGTSVTTGATNTVVWNEIHHKTESTSNYSGHGYPDPAYLDNVLAELAAQGVEEGDDEGEGSSSSSDGDL